MGTPALPEGPFSIVYADPPWDYGNQVQHGGANKPFTTGAQTYYPTMTAGELAHLPVRHIIAPKSILFMWTTGPQLDVAVWLCSQWGFNYKTVAFVWDKCRVNPGAYTMSQYEYVLVGTRGGIPRPRGARNVRQHVREPRTEHSRKPDEVRRRIDAMFPDPALARIELFARRTAQGWVSWGNEVPG